MMSTQTQTLGQMVTERKTSSQAGPFVLDATGDFLIQRSSYANIHQKASAANIVPRGAVPTSSAFTNVVTVQFVVNDASTSIDNIERLFLRLVLNNSSGVAITTAVPFWLLQQCRIYCNNVQIDF